MTLELAKAKQISVEAGGTLQSAIEALQSSVTAAEEKAEWGQVSGSISNQTDLTTALSTKVDKVEGKVLSDNNYTTAEKNKLATAATQGDILSAVENKVDKEPGKELINPAPVDGMVYGRYNGGWSQIVLTGIEEAPTDGKQYARKDSDWTEVVATGEQSDWNETDSGSEAFIKNKPAIPSVAGLATETYVNNAVSPKADKSYVDTELSGKIGDAPQDSKQYARKDGTWSEVTGGGEEIPLIDPSFNLSYEQLIGELRAIDPAGPAAFYYTRVLPDSVGQWQTGNFVTHPRLFRKVSQTDSSIPSYGSFSACYLAEWTTGVTVSREYLQLSNAYGSAETYSWSAKARSAAFPWDSPSSRSFFDSDKNYILSFKKGSSSPATEQVLSPKEITIDSNGFIKEASPIVNLFTNTLVHNKDASVDGAVLNKTSVGVYEISGVPLLSRNGWYIETPKDRNNNVYFTIDYEEIPEENKLIIRTYEPDYTSGKAENGNPVDILEGRFVALRFEEVEEEEQEQE